MGCFIEPVQEKKKGKPDTLCCVCNPIFRPSCKPVSLSFPSVWLHQLIKMFHSELSQQAQQGCFIRASSSSPAMRKKKKTHHGLRHTPTSSPALLVQSSLIKAYACPRYRQVHLQTTIRQASVLPLCRLAINPANVICGCNPLEKLNWSVSTASGVLPVAKPVVTPPPMDRAPQASVSYGWRRTLCWRRFRCHYHVCLIRPLPWEWLSISFFICNTALVHSSASRLFSLSLNRLET